MLSKINNSGDRREPLNTSHTGIHHLQMRTDKTLVCSQYKYIKGSSYIYTNPDRPYPASSEGSRGHSGSQRYRKSKRRRFKQINPTTILREVPEDVSKTHGSRQSTETLLSQLSRAILELILSGGLRSLI